MRRWIYWAVLGAAMAGAAVRAQVPAAVTTQEALDACRVLENPVRRLACYDAIPGATVTGGPAEVAPAPDAEGEPGRDERQPERDRWIFPPRAETPLDRSRMVRRWELDDATDGGLLRIRAFRPVYALPARWSNDMNERPETPTLGTPARPENLDNLEAKFQFSLKTKVWNNLIADNGDIWVGFTQQSNWQAYNSTESKPFRETNFSPEVFTSWRTGLDLFGLRWQMLNLGFVHQSNGQGGVLSRSWNRVYAQFGFERNAWEVHLRPWVRVEPSGTDDNPDIEDFLGNHDLRVIWHRGQHDLGLTTRWAPDENRGAVQFDWHYPLVGDLKAYLQFFHGYGETLIDYNHKQTTVGLGVSLVQ